MAEITASMVKELREKTDAPMMECKKALTEAGGDMAKAEEILRVKLGNKASKAASRVAAEGVVGMYQSADGKLGAMVEVNCETDFVAKNDDFLALAKALRRTGGHAQPGRRGGAVGAADGRGHGRVDAHRTGRQDRREHVDPPLHPHRGQRSPGVSYIHGGSKIGVLIDLVGGDEQLGKDLAMHIAASKPKSLDASGVPAELIDTERRIAIEKARESGKPEAIVEKMVEGTVQKFLQGSDPAWPGLREGRGRQADRRAAAEGKGRVGGRLHAVRGRRGHREEVERFRRRSGRPGRRRGALTGRIRR